MTQVLRPYQARAVEAVRAELRAGARAVLVTAPTGSGKGTIAAHLLASAAARGRRAAVIAPRVELVRDLAARVARAAALPVSVYAGADTAVEAGALLAVGTVQTLAARDVPLDVDLLIADEAHHGVCAQYRAVRDASPRAVLVGLTATPQRGDGAALGDVYQAMVVAASVRELTDAGHLVPAVVLGPGGRRRAMAEDPVDALAQHGGVVSGPEPSAAWSPGQAMRRAIVFARDVAHARDVAERARAAGMRAAAVDSHDDAARADGVARFARAELDVLVNVAILTEGYDDPSVEVVVLAAGIGHAGGYLQRVGRALRPAPGKRGALVLDLLGISHDHGLPDDDRAWSLAGEPCRTRSDLEAIRQCPDCGGVFRAAAYVDATCPRCGAVTAGREDPAVRREALARIAAAETATQRAAYLWRLVATARANGYKPGWVDIRFAAKYGGARPTPDERAHAARSAS